MMTLLAMFEVNHLQCFFVFCCPTPICYVFNSIFPRVCSEALGGCCEAPPVFADQMLSAASQEHSARGHVLHAARYVLGRSSSLFTQLGARHARRLVPVPGSLFYEA